MVSNTINAGTMAKLFLAGAKNLESKKEWINELNVFPVPDGDTGTNMTLTIMSAAREVAALHDMGDVDMQSLCKAISSGSLRGARGNSGVILSQLFRGFTKVVKEYDEVTIPVIASAFEKAVETAYKAVMKPKEGTILTVAKGAAVKARELADSGMEDMADFLAQVIERADEVLEQTPDMLPVLKQAGVVDSGGQGLMQVLKGVYDAYTGKEIDLTLSSEQTSHSGGKSAGAGLEAQANADIKFGYCTEFIIMLNKVFNIKTEMDFKAYLESIGDSIVVVADEDVVKVHVHTNDPGLAIQKALKYGALSNMKIDNMRLEHQEKLFKQSQKEAAEKPAAEEQPKKDVGFIAVSVGDGINEIFK
ncbi:MAG: DAK2 domain-containing protein, partial [Lachnospiraceae bacterium]|nr:DAK2 domain-containing protein [Lachnospiraceae bacterium]